MPSPPSGGQDEGTLTKSGTTTTTITIVPVESGAGDVPSSGGAGGSGGAPGAPGGGNQVPSDETAGNGGGAGAPGGCKPVTVTTTTVLVSTITVTPTPAIPTFGNHKPEEEPSSPSVPADLAKTSSSSTPTSEIPAKPTGFPGNGTHNGTWADWTGSTGFLTVSKYATETPSGWKPWSSDS
jgi:hypothetical protein